MIHTPPPFADDADLDEVRRFRADLATPDDDRVAVARERFAEQPGAGDRASGRGRTTKVVAGACAVGIAAAVAVLVVWTWPGGSSSSGVAPAGGSTSTTTATATETPTPGWEATSTGSGAGGGSSDPFAPGGALHCMALHDEPLGEVAQKLARTDLTMTYTLPDPQAGTQSHLSQAEAEADTENKVSEVLYRGNQKLEVYFWGNENKDFMNDEMAREFEERCPNPR